MTKPTERRSKERRTQSQSRTTTGVFNRLFNRRIPGSERRRTQPVPSPGCQNSHSYRTVERDRKWVSICEYCGFNAPAAPAPTATGRMPSCHVCGTIMEGVCPKCQTTTAPTLPQVTPATEEEALQWLMDNYGMSEAEGHGTTLNLLKVPVGDSLYVFYLVGKDGNKRRFSQALAEFANRSAAPAAAEKEEK